MKAPVRHKGPWAFRAYRGLDSAYISKNPICWRRHAGACVPSRKALELG